MIYEMIVPFKVTQLHVFNYMKALKKFKWKWQPEALTVSQPDVWQAPIFVNLKKNNHKAAKL